MKGYFDMVIAPTARKLEVMLMADDNPGLVNRYVLQEVKEPPEVPVNVKVNGYCNHAGAEIEMIEYAKPSWYADAHCYAMDDSEELPTLVCKCGYEEIQEQDND